MKIGSQENKSSEMIFNFSLKYFLKSKSIFKNLKVFFSTTNRIQLLFYQTTNRMQVLFNITCYRPDSKYSQFRNYNSISIFDTWFSN